MGNPEYWNEMQLRAMRLKPDSVILSAVASGALQASLRSKGHIQAGLVGSIVIIRVDPDSYDLSIPEINGAKIRLLLCEKYLDPVVEADFDLVEPDSIEKIGDWLFTTIKKHQMEQWGRHVDG
jgi:hypothetical protein